MFRDSEEPPAIVRILLLRKLGTTGNVFLRQLIHFPQLPAPGLIGQAIIASDFNPQFIRPLQSFGTHSIQY